MDVFIDETGLKVIREGTVYADIFAICDFLADPHCREYPYVKDFFTWALMLRFPLSRRWATSSGVIALGTTS